MIQRFQLLPPFVRGLLVWQLSAFCGSLLTVVIWFVARLSPSDLAGVGPYILMSWAISSMLSTPAAIAIFAFAVTAQPDQIQRRILRTHDIGAALTMLIFFGLLAFEVGGIPENRSGLLEPAILAIVYPTVGSFIWRQFLSRTR